LEAANHAKSTVDFDRTLLQSVPAAPWLLRGAAVAFFDGKGVALQVNYTESPVGPYHETARVGWQRRPKVVQMRVNSVASRRGGRRVWGFPKTLADITWHERRNRIEVRAKGEVFRWRACGPQIPISLRAFTVQRFRGADVRVPVAVSGRVQFAFRGMQLGVVLHEMKLVVEAPR
jgi:hypothetical protein